MFGSFTRELNAIGKNLSFQVIAETQPRFKIGILIFQYPIGCECNVEIDETCDHAILWKLLHGIYKRYDTSLINSLGDRWFVAEHTRPWLHIK